MKGVAVAALALGMVLLLTSCGDKTLDKALEQAKQGEYTMALNTLDGSKKETAEITALRAYLEFERELGKLPREKEEAGHSFYNMEGKLAGLIEQGAALVPLTALDGMLYQTAMVKLEALRAIEAGYPTLDALVQQAMAIQQAAEAQAQAWENGEWYTPAEVQTRLDGWYAECEAFQVDYALVFGIRPLEVAYNENGNATYTVVSNTTATNVLKQTLNTLDLMQSMQDRGAEKGEDPNGTYRFNSMGEYWEFLRITGDFAYTMGGLGENDMREEYVMVMLARSDVLQGLPE